MEVLSLRAEHVLNAAHCHGIRASTNFRAVLLMNRKRLGLQTTVVQNSKRFIASASGYPTKNSIGAGSG